MISNVVGESLITESQYAALSLAIPPGGVFLEVGTWHGVTAARLADDHPDALIVSVDPFIGRTGTPPDPSFYVRNRHQRPNMRGFVGTVQELAALWNRDVQVDAVFVDAVHKYPDVLDDLNAALPLVQRRGLLFAHDYDEKDYPGVVRSVAEFCAQHGMRVLNRIDPTWSLVTIGRP